MQATDDGCCRAEALRRASYLVAFGRAEGEPGYRQFQDAVQGAEWHTHPKLI